jgi:hypothetical protein
MGSVTSQYLNVKSKILLQDLNMEQLDQELSDSQQDRGREIAADITNAVDQRITSVSLKKLKDRSRLSWNRERLTSPELAEAEKIWIRTFARTHQRLSVQAAI